MTTKKPTPGDAVRAAANARNFTPSKEYWDALAQAAIDASDAHKVAKKMTKVELPQYTKSELRAMAKRMRGVANGIYPALTHTGCHTFVEFCGLMQKYVDVCERAAEQGIEFPLANRHTCNALPVEEHDLRYLAEKLECIFGPIIDANPRAKRVFARALLGVEL